MTNHFTPRCSCMRGVIKHLLHSSAVRYGEIFPSPYLTLTRVISLMYRCIDVCNFFFVSFKILAFRSPFQHRKASLQIYTAWQLEKSSWPFANPFAVGLDIGMALLGDGKYSCSCHVSSQIYNIAQGAKLLTVLIAVH